MFASKTTGKCGAVAIALATFAAAAPSFAQDDRVLDPHASVTPSAIALSSAARVRVEANAIVERLPRVALSSSGGVRAHQLRLREGTIQVEASQEEGTTNIRIVGDNLVEVPGVDASGPVLVRCPRGQVVIVEDGLATVSVVDGYLRVTNHRGKTLVGTGQSPSILAEGQARVEGCKGPTVRPVPSAPVFAAGKRIWVAAGTNTVQPRSLAWTGPENASRYLVRVEREDQDAAPLSFFVDGTNFADAAPPLAPGRYTVTLRAEDACGISGAETQAEPIRVVGLALPSGSYQDDQGTIRTEVGARIRLTHARGTSLGFPNVDRWVPAPRALTLRRDVTQDFLLKTAGGEPALIRLAPRNIQALVHLGPHNVRWPGPGVAVTVKLQSGEGQSVPSWIEPVTKVTVGAKQVHLKWRRDGDTLHGVIPPQPELLPCVVRVEVTDQFGLPLGRNFLEVTGARS